MAFKLKEYQWANSQLKKKHQQHTWITLSLAVVILILLRFMASPVIPAIVILLGIIYVEYRASKIKKQDKIIKAQMQTKATQEKLTQNIRRDS